MNKTQAPSDNNWIAGVDEAGRGPLAGPVFAAAVILNPASAPIVGLRDSKKLTHAKREALFEVISNQAVAFFIARASVAEIDEYNILQATLLAMRRAVEGLSAQVCPSLVLVDGNRLPKLAVPAKAIIQGDDSVAAISAASILAKVTRDRLCLQMECDFPGYGFAQHKGYGTAAHLAALQRLGACPLHRRSFAPVAQVIRYSHLLAGSDPNQQAEPSQHS